MNRLVVLSQHALLALALSLPLAGCSPGEKAAAPPSKISTDNPPPADEKTALDAYVATPDPHYSFKLISTAKGKGYTSYVLEMTSQQYLTTNEVDRPIWKHWVTITQPDNVTHTNALLFIGGGANGGAPPKGGDENLAAIAMATKSVLAELKMVPNQPLVFKGEKEGRKEDSLIAYTWDKFLRTGDAKWPARLPMTKAAVRAMDTVSTFCATNSGAPRQITGFVVAGGSKRGWTTWTTAAVDKRVVAIIPIVIDVLNMEPSMLHHYAAYGFWAPAIQNYTEFNIMEWIGTPEIAALMKIEGPYQYRARFTMPKLLMNASGDQFFLPDSSQFYFDNLPGVKYLRYIPNTDHGLRNSDAYQSVTTFYTAILDNLHMPEFDWTLEKDGSIRATCKDQPNYALLWQASNPEARDFRLETLGPKWKSSMLAPEKKGVYLGKVPLPEKGWTAFFIEFGFPSSKDTADFKFTTQVQVVPDTLPFKFVPKGKPQ